MTTCPTCSRALPEGVQFCAGCGTKLPTDSFVATQLIDEAGPARAARRADRTPRETGRAPSSADTLGRGRFVAGTRLADRYRIITLLGRGGMGEVYKAEDLKLEQTVSLKFLPESLSADGAALARLYREVRVARQISHRNVCRVYDIGEAEGLHFLSMEFVPGEELSSLLRRIGRLPEDKAVEVARQLCAGLAAAHEQGVLHRDLKPANVMIDDAGNVRVLDFGLAGLAEDFRGRDIASGTPAYMAPEQLAGREVTARSDIYALGLVLYELFTGKRAFEARSLEELLRLRESNSTPTSPSSLVKDLDPLVERVINRCLETEPQRRPASALQVAAALPGGDPVAAALAAGETPSPEMVAAAPKEGILRPWVAAALLASVVAAMAFVAITSDKVSLHRFVPLEKTPEVLRERASEIARRLGYAERPTDTADGFDVDFDYLGYVNAHDQSRGRWERLRAGHPPALYFWHRRSPRHLEPQYNFFVAPDDPANNVAGMLRIDLDTTGRLHYFEAVPPQLDDAARQTTAQPTPAQPTATPPTSAQPATTQTASDALTQPQAEWAAQLFREAGLDAAAFRPAASQWVPPHAYDARAAWEGAFGESADVPVRVEAAAFGGRPVYFEIVAPWSRPARAVEESAGSRSELAGFLLLLAIFFGSLVAGAAHAWRNLRRGWGDRRGAFRLAFFVFATRLVYWVTVADHSPTLREVGNLVGGLQSAVFWACFVGLMYLGLEPFLRRRWPARIISWSRLLAGDWRDPLVGRDVLVGAAAGMLVCVLSQLQDLVPLWAGLTPNIPEPVSGVQFTLLPRGFLPFLMNQIDAALSFTFMTAFVLLFLSMLLRSNRLGIGAGWLLISCLLVLMNSHKPAVSWPFAVAVATVHVLVLTRFGVLATAAALFFHHFIVFFPYTTELTAWYATGFILNTVSFILVALCAFHTSLGGQPLFRRGLLEE